MSATHFPVAIFCYKRLDHLQKTVASLLACPEAQNTAVTFFSDAARNAVDYSSVQRVRDYIRELDGFYKVTIVERPYNFGLKKSILEGVTNMLSESEGVIVLEDDIVVAPGFLGYINMALAKYRLIKSVCSISGFSYIDFKSRPSYFLLQPMCWGWATWSDRWGDFTSKIDPGYSLSRSERRMFNYEGGFDFFKQYALNSNGKINTWYVFWYLYCFSNNLLSLYPAKTLTRNLGFDGTGDNSSVYVDYNTPLWGETSFHTDDTGFFPVEDVYDVNAYKDVCVRLKALKPPVRKRALRKVNMIYEKRFNR